MSELHPIFKDILSAYFPEVKLNGGVCENCSQRVIHRHSRRVSSGGCEDTLWLCRKCDPDWQCDECVEESALSFYELAHGGSADKLADEAMITASFAIAFADKFHYWLSARSEIVR